MYATDLVDDLVCHFSCSTAEKVELLIVSSRSSSLQVECDQDCTTVLRQRMAEGLLHKAVIHPDVCKFSAKETGACGVTAGFPCQACVVVLSFESIARRFI